MGSRSLLQEIFPTQGSNLGLPRCRQILYKLSCQGSLIQAEYIMRNAGLDEAQAGIMFTGRNINNLRYAGDTTLMAECEEELKSLLMKLKEESEKAGLNSIFRK